MQLGSYSQLPTLVSVEFRHEPPSLGRGRVAPSPSCHRNGSGQVSCSQLFLGSIAKLDFWVQCSIAQVIKHRKCIAAVMGQYCSNLSIFYNDRLVKLSNYWRNIYPISQDRTPDCRATYQIWQLLWARHLMGLPLLMSG